MSERSDEGLFFQFLRKFSFDEKDLDYSLLDKHKVILQLLSDVGHSGVNIFDVSKRQIAFFSSNFGKTLGYDPADYRDTMHEFFYMKIHPQDLAVMNNFGVSFMKIFSKFSRNEKLDYKAISEYRMLNAQNKYVRLIEQYQVLELDNQGQIWLLVGIVDVSANQEEYEGVKTQQLNFKTGETIPWEIPQETKLELTKRELQILKLVKDGLLSKEISNRLSISLHTVNTHRQRFLEKLGANNSFEAVQFASRFGLLG